MCSRFLSLAFAVSLAVGNTAAQQSVLRVCADPDNLPFSNAKRQGFENRIAELVATSLGKKLEYKWVRFTGRGFVRNTINERECDLLPGVPSDFKPVLTTDPYYRSAYVFVSRADRKLALHSFDDPALKPLRIGIQVVEEEYAPPAIALGRRGLLTNIVGYEAIGKDASNIVEAVATGKVDTAIVWGPLAGYYARRRGRRLELSNAPEFDSPALPLAFSIAMGVRKSDGMLRDQINAALRARHADVRRILASYGIPLLPLDIKREIAKQ
jgi:mxaJ protein